MKRAFFGNINDPLMAMHCRRVKLSELQGRMSLQEAQVQNYYKFIKMHSKKIGIICHELNKANAVVEEGTLQSLTLAQVNISQQVALTKA